MKFLKDNPDFDIKEGKTVQSFQDYVKILEVVYEELYQGLELNELHYEAARLQTRLVEQFVKIQKLKLAKAMETGKPAQTHDLLSQAKKYDELLNQVKGGASND
jgi:hypothetical protein